MSAVSCMTPQEVIHPTKFINETQLGTCRNYCILSKPLTRLLLCTATRYSALVFLSRLISVFSKGHLVADWFSNTQVKIDEAKVPFLSFSALIWLTVPHHGYDLSLCSSLLLLVKASPGTGTGKWSVIANGWHTLILELEGGQRTEWYFILELHNFLDSKVTPSPS